MTSNFFVHVHDDFTEIESNKTRVLSLVLVVVLVQFAVDWVQMLWFKKALKSTTQLKDLVVFQVIFPVPFRFIPALRQHAAFCAVYNTWMHYLIFSCASCAISFVPRLSDRRDCLPVRKEEAQLLGDEIGESNAAMVFFSKDINFTEICSIQVICTRAQTWMLEMCFHFPSPWSVQRWQNWGKSFLSGTIFSVKPAAFSKKEQRVGCFLMPVSSGCLQNQACGVLSLGSTYCMYIITGTVLWLIHFSHFRPQQQYIRRPVNIYAIAFCASFLKTKDQPKTIFWAIPTDCNMSKHVPWVPHYYASCFLDKVLAWQTISAYHNKATHA